jgi:hypothetical protein
MNNLQKMGGVAAPIGVATNLVAFGFYFTLLAPTGYGIEDFDPGQYVVFLVDNQTIMYIWNLIIYAVFAVFLVVLSLALYAGGLGPYGFSPAALKRAIQEYLEVMNLDTTPESLTGD